MKIELICMMHFITTIPSITAHITVVVVLFILEYSRIVKASEGQVYRYNIISNYYQKSLLSGEVSLCCSVIHLIAIIYYLCQILYYHT